MLLTGLLDIWLVARMLRGSRNNGYRFFAVSRKTVHLPENVCVRNVEFINCQANIKFANRSVQ